jgi:Protein-disulfide isomerase
MNIKKNLKHRNIFSVFIDLLNVKYTKYYSSKLYEEHPHKYNLFGLSSMLSIYSIENKGIQFEDKSVISEIETPFIAHIGSNFVVVYKVAKNQVFYIWQGKDVKVPVEKFNNIWTGAILLAELNENSIEPNYKGHLVKEILISLQKIAVIIAVFILLIFGIVINNKLHNNIGLFSLAITNLLGVYIGSLLVLKQLHVNSRYADKICSLFRKNDCNNILESKASKLGGIIGWSEIGLGYFIANTIIIFEIPRMIPYLAIINMFTLPYSFWSIWYQKFKANQWCTLCLIVQLLLWSIFLIDLEFRFIQLPQEGMANILAVVSLYSFLILTINLIIPVLGRGKKVNAITQELNSLKSNENILAALLRRQTQYEVSKDTSNILWGNPNANILITILTNPHCEPCAIMHERIKTVLTNDSICVQYIFLAFPGMQELELSNKFLIAIYQDKDSEEREKIFDTWFNEGKLKRVDFFGKYNMNLEDKKILNEYEKHKKWIARTGLNETPTVLINGCVLPNIYKIEDMKYITHLDVNTN